MGETVQKKLSKKDIIKSYLIWTFFSHSTYNYERMQASGVLHAIAPSLEKLYGKDTQELREACERHMEFFNTEPNVGGCILGITLALEEQKANGEDVDPEMISSIKTGLMGPLAGIGDTIWQGTLSPIALGIILGMAKVGNFMGPLIYLLTIGIVLFGLGYVSYTKGYYMGREGIGKIIGSGLLNRVTEKATVVGGTLDVQTAVLDSIFKGILPLTITLLTVFLLKKKVNVNVILLILIAIGAVGTLIGFF